MFYTDFRLDKKILQSSIIVYFNQICRQILLLSIIDIFKIRKLLINWAITEAVQSCSERKLFWKCSEYNQEHICIGVQNYKNCISPRMFFWNASIIIGSTLWIICWELLCSGRNEREGNRPVQHCRSLWKLKIDGIDKAFSIKYRKTSKLSSRTLIF